MGHDHLYLTLFDANILNEYSTVVTSLFGFAHSFSMCTERAFGARYCKKQLKHLLYLADGGCASCERYSRWVEAHMAT